MEIIKPKSPVRLRTIFLWYFSLLCAGLLVWLGVLLAVYYAGLAGGGILPANYAEKQIAAATDTLESSRILSPEQIPFLSDYAVYSTDGSFLYGNLTPNDAAKAWESVQTGSKGGPYRFYTVIQRDNEICILSYSVMMQFQSKFLRTYFPTPEVLGIILFISGFLIQLVVWSFLFGKKLSRKMAGLQAVTEKIQSQNLDFTVQTSGVYEIDAVLDSLEKMKEELKISLKQQWELQQSRREQISALAHDIKTPLTIIRGNAELLTETAQDDTQREYNRYILKSTAQIEQYAMDLIDLSKAEEGMKLHWGKVNTEDLLTEIEEQMKALSVEKTIEVQVKKHRFPEFITLDNDLFNRAILNVIMNAVEHTPVEGRISLTAEGTGHSVRFIIRNSGSGFSAVDLKEATKQFYMGDRSRTAGKHHGMGLYITQSIIQQHGGSVLLENDVLFGGGKVTLEIPLNIQ